jgi:hypothetical protein
MITGDNPSFIGWAPMPRITGRPSLRALMTALTTDRKSLAANASGSFSRNVPKESPFAGTPANEVTDTLLFLDESA